LEGDPAVPATLSRPETRDLDALLDELPELLTRRELCAFLRISRRCLDDWIKAGRFPRPIAFNDWHHRWTKAGVRRWLRDTAARDKEDGER
jgi:predicted DNA-binding transcriptional regulator AlpA